MRPILILLIFLLATAALASDGVHEINQTCAVQTGCIDNSGDIGDGPGFPVNIEIPGSYILTSNLVVSDPNTSGLFIAASPITIDLNGFEIKGPINCTGFGSSLTCNAGTGQGIRSPQNRGTVMNGSIVGFGSDGILLGGSARVERVIVERNGGNGIQVGRDSIVIGCRAYRNFGNGIETSTASTVDRSTSASNRSFGFLMAEGAVISASTARDNGQHGILVFDGSTVSGNAVYQNGADGIQTNKGSTVVGNAAYENVDDGIHVNRGSTVSDNTAYLNGDDGIFALLGSTVQRNTVTNNGDFGIALSDTSSYRENTITENATGAVSAGVNLGDNYCSGPGVVSSSCP